MNALNSDQEDAPLSALLREWKTDATLPPRFREEVWQQITREGTAPGVSLWADLWRSIEAALRRPALAIAYLTVLLAVGLSAGLFQAREKASQTDHALQARYLQSVDPYQKPR
jgi:hypothetical protein